MLTGSSNGYIKKLSCLDWKILAIN
ncbi:hypothetical protein Goarm_012775, partial [Gossypium armourianum]|nr:hypothetical protein [Gossypium armourianum]